MQSTGRSQAVRATLPDGSEYLVVVVDIVCPGCGPIHYVIPGHHLRTVRDLVIAAIDGHPDLTGKDGDLKVIERLTVEGRPPIDPTEN